MAEEDHDLVLYSIDTPLPTPAAKPAAGTTPPDDEEDQRRGAGARAGGQGGTRAAGAAAPKLQSVTLYVRNLVTGKEESHPMVGQRIVSKDGHWLAFTLVSTEAKDRSVVVEDLTKTALTTLSKGNTKYAKLTWHDKTNTLAFITDASKDAKTLAVHVWHPGDAATKALVTDGAAGIPANWVLTDTTNISFSEKGSRMTFTVTPKAPETKPDATPDDENVSVDIWHYKDPLIQTVQLLQVAADRTKSISLFADTKSGKITQLGNELYSSVALSIRGEGRYGLATTGMPYRVESTWDPGYSDSYLFDAQTGKAEKVSTHENGFVSLSPSGRFLIGYDSKARVYFSIDIASKKRTELTKSIPYPLYDEIADVPDDPGAYGIAGWTTNDDRVLIYDSYDLWSIDPSGKVPPENVTGGWGRVSKTRVRIQSTDPDADTIDASKPLLVSLFDTESKAGGFATLDVTTKRLTKLIYGDKTYTVAARAKNADVLVYSQQTFTEYPNLWLSNTKFEGGKQITDANPQQKDYNWGKSELVQWTSNDGVPLKGILIKPENFDYSKKYPMITYFYERSSDTLNRYTPPAPSASTVNLSMYASNGYVIFVPDIPYKIGYPGESAMSAILPGVQSIVARGYVDPKRLGIQGQSWGGYQVAYLVTETNMFAAACSGAAVSDMFSAYGGIRYGSGLLRQMQYEHQQSRIAGTPWEKPLRYIENSPLFFLDKVTTPLLMMHNDKDGSVPWTQGVELYSGMRRLQKPCWMVTYNGEDHNLVERKNRKDWSVRMQQFFDHYLKGAPEPVWMSKGIPATEKGKTMGLEIGK